MVIWRSGVSPGALPYSSANDPVAMISLPVGDDNQLAKNQAICRSPLMRQVWTKEALNAPVVYLVRFFLVRNASENQKQADKSPTRRELYRSV